MTDDLTFAQEQAFQMRQEIQELGRFLPGLWTRIERAHIKERAITPGWSFVSAEALDNIIEGYVRLDAARPGTDMVLVRRYIEQTRDDIRALGAWRFSQGIYVIDPEVFELLWETPLDGEIATQVLQHLPEHSIYVPWNTTDTHLTFQGRLVLGFMFGASVGDPEMGDWCLDIHVRTQDPDEGRCFRPITVPMAYPTIRECISALQQLVREGLEATRTALPDLTDEALKDIDWMIEMSSSVTDQQAELVSHAINLAIYIASQKDCSSGRRTPLRAVIKKVAGKRTIIAPNQATFWNVGTRAKAAMRARAAGGAT